MGSDASMGRLQIDDFGRCCFLSDFRNVSRWLLVLLSPILVVGCSAGVAHQSSQSQRGSSASSAPSAPVEATGTTPETPVVQGAPAAEGFVVVAAGDIACDPKYPNFNGGQGTDAGCQQKATSDVALAAQPQAVLALGDIQYVHGTSRNYQKSYGPSWGRLESITDPALGNHEGGEGGDNTQYFDYFGIRAGDPSQGYYSLDLGSWHLVVLNSNCGRYVFNGDHAGCQKGSPQELWLKQDLATHPNACAMAMWHVPRFSSGGDHYSNASIDHTLTALWDDLYAAHADIILNGHSHLYERFAPLNPEGRVDAGRGIREFIVGTGGDNHANPREPLVQGNEYLNNNSFGVLKLTLQASSYSWQFERVKTPSATNTDSGTAACH